MIFNFSFNNINLTIQDPQVVVLSHLVIILHNFNSDFFLYLIKNFYLKNNLYLLLAFRLTYSSLS